MCAENRACDVCHVLVPEVLHVLETKMRLSPALSAQVTSLQNALSIMKDEKIDHTKANLDNPVRKTQASWLAALKKADADKLGESAEIACPLLFALCHPLPPNPHRYQHPHPYPEPRTHLHPPSRPHADRHLQPDRSSFGTEAAHRAQAPRLFLQCTLLRSIRST